MTLTLFQKILFVVFFIAILDFAWISLNKHMYFDMFSNIQSTPVQVRILQACITYIFVIILFISYVFPDLENGSRKIFKAGILGGCVYGIYNFTNFALFEKYTWKVALLDSFWGMALFTIIAYCYKKSSLLS